jgi:Ni/Co efflux regulator RcnB
MNNKAIISATMAVCLMASVSAFAQNNDHRNDRNDRNDQAQHDNDHNRGNDDHNDSRSSPHNESRGAGPRHDMHRGERLSNDYRGNKYVVNDWRNRHLSAPPRGSHWVRAGDDYVLVAITTGIIAQILLNN